MAPLTSASCDSCSRLADKISELETRISTLYQIQEAERLMDTITYNPPLTDTTNPRVHAAPSPAAEVASPPDPALCPATAVPPPPSVSDVSWTRLGAKPKSLVSSTPFQHCHWSLPTAGSRRGACRSRDPPHFDIPLENKFDILAMNDFPLLSADSRTPPPSSRPLPSAISVHSTRPRTRRSIPQLTPAPRRADASPPFAPPPVAVPPSPSSFPPSPPESRHSSPRPLFPPTALIVGDSIIRRVRFFNAITRCFPGATVPDILSVLPALLQSVPSSVTTVIIHVGTNDTALSQSECTKMDFKKLLNFLSSCGLRGFICSPTPSLGRGSQRFSRLLSLHTWLQSTCISHHVSFIDNFNLFWNRHDFYSSDGIHHSSLGTRILAANIQYSVQSLSPAA